MLPQFRFIVKATKKRNKFWVFDKKTQTKVSGNFATYSEADKEQMKMTQIIMRFINED